MTFTERVRGALGGKGVGFLGDSPLLEGLGAKGVSHMWLLGLEAHLCPE